jgi:lactate dehydrogenase-like 2-hydroxyacid dehydrogenase
MDALAAEYKVHKLWQAEDPEARLSEIKDDISALVSTAFSGVSAKLIRALPNLEIISHFGVGYDSIDVKAAKERGIVVTNTPDVLTDDTADMGMALTLAVHRRIVEGDMYVRSGQWAKKGPLPLGRALRGRTMGIFGLGRIGRAVAARAEAFGMRIVYAGTAPKDGVDYPFYKTAHDLAAACDVLLLACAYNEQTHHAVDARVLKALGKTGVLVNIARGRVVDEAALVDALESGHIAGAGLDVFENEPDVPHALCRLDNVVLQPHQGSATRETRAAMADLVVKNLRLYFERAEVLTPV